MRKRFCISIFLLFSLWLNLAAQQPTQQPTPSPAPVQTPAAAQSGAASDRDAEVVRITTNLVQVDAVVTRDGKHITDLKPQDFELFEDGRPQTITNFSYISNIPAAATTPAPPAVQSTRGDKTRIPVLPAAVDAHAVRRTFALVVDDLGMSFESMGQMKHQLRKFVDEQLQPNDLAAIIRTGGEVGSLQQFTTDRRLLYRAIEQLKWNGCSRSGFNVFTPLGTLTVNNDNYGSCGWKTTEGTLTALRFILEGMRDLPGRKSMAVFSDDLPMQRQEPSAPVIPEMSAFQKIAELAIRASVVIYTVDTRGLQYVGLTTMDRYPLPPGFSRQGKAVGDTNATPGPAVVTVTRDMMRSRSMALTANREGHEYLAKQTGGFLVYNSNDFGLKQVIDDQRGYYLIGYRPGDQTFNRSFHHIKLSVKGKGLQVRTRTGFYGFTESEAPARELTAQDQMNRSLMSPFGANEITVRLTAFFVNDPVSGSLLRTFLYLDPHALTFADEPDGGHLASFDLSQVVFGDNGKVISRQDQTKALRLHGQAYERALSDGAVYAFDIPMKQFGAFQLRVAVRDTITSRLGSAGQFVEIPNLSNHRLVLSDVIIRGLKTSTDGQGEADDEINHSPAVRRFHQGSRIAFAYSVYNAISDQGSHLPRVTTQTRLFRDGKPVYTGNPSPLDPAGQSDPERITAGSQLQLGPQLSPGQYVLQIVVEDLLAKEKRRTVTQSIDFEVVK